MEPTKMLILKILMIESCYVYVASHETVGGM